MNGTLLAVGCLILVLLAVTAAVLRAAWREMIGASPPVAPIPDEPLGEMGERYTQHLREARPAAPAELLGRPIVWTNDPWAGGGEERQMIVMAGPGQPRLYLWLDGIDVSDVTVRADVPRLELVEAPGWVDLVFLDVAASLERQTTVWKTDLAGRPRVERRHGTVLWTRKPLLLGQQTGGSDQASYFTKGRP